MVPTRRRRNKPKVLPEVTDYSRNYVDEDLAIIRKGNQVQRFKAQPAIQTRDFTIIPIPAQKRNEHRPYLIESQKVYNVGVQNTVKKDTKRCRLCLKYCQRVISIFREDFPRMVEILTALKMDKSDTRFSTVACLQCAKDVKNAVAVRKRIIQSQKTLIEEFKNQILQCVIETEPSEHHTYFETEPEVKYEIPTVEPTSGAIYPIDGALPVHPQMLNDDNVVYEVEIQTVCPNNTMSDGSDVNVEDLSSSDQLLDFSDNITRDLAKKFKPIRPNVGTRRTLQTSKILEKTTVGRSRRTDKIKTAKSGAIVKNNVPIMPLAKRKQILAEYKKAKDLEKQNKIKKEAGPEKKTFGRRKPINPLMNSRIRERLVAIKEQQPEPFPKNEKIPCSVCQKIVLGRNMIKHMDVHSTEPIICTLCNAVCKNGNSLQSHIFYYHKCKADEFVCDECGRAFRFKYKFMLHKKVHHGGVKDHECEHCGKKFFTNVTLIRHIKAVHKKIKSHFCEYCGRGFQSKYGLRTHVRIHTLEAPYQCSFCEECFRQKVSLRNHLKSKHNMEENSTIFCETCGKGFSSDVALASHVRKLHEIQKCPKCSESFASAEYLNKHLKSVHEEVEKIGEYEGRHVDQQCPLCLKIFANSDVLNNHMENIHGVSNMTLNLDKSGDRTTLTLGFI